MPKVVKVLKLTLVLVDSFNQCKKSGQWPDFCYREKCSKPPLFFGRRCITIYPRYSHILAAIFLIGIMLMPGVAKASDEVVEKVSVTIKASQTPPSRIAKRMSASVGTVGEQMLVGRNISEVDRNKGVYEKLIQEIFDRVVVGYSVESVTLTSGASTMLTVTVAPWGDVVTEVALEMDYGTIAPELIDLVKKDMGKVQEQVDEVLIGLPIDAVDWAGGISKIVIRELLSSQLPEFHTNFEIIPGARTIVKLSLSPKGATVQDVHVSLRSHTIPNLLLMAVRPTVDQASKNLVGLPVAFIERHHDYFTARLANHAAQNPLTKNYGLHLTPIINAGVDTEIVLDAETDKYKVSIEGYMDMGRKEENTSLRLHAGKFMGKKDEIFTEVNFIPSTVTWNFVPGWGHTFSAGITAGIKYDISEKRNILWLQHDVNRNISLRFERTPKTGQNEFGIRYKMHDFLSAEYVFTQKNTWLRLISNL